MYDVSKTFAMPMTMFCTPSQRVYGIAFPEKDQMKDFQYRMEEARKRDHRNVGTQQQLFMFDRLSPGSAFFLPGGTVVYNALVDVSQYCSCAAFSVVSAKSPCQGTVVYNALVHASLPPAVLLQLQFMKIYEAPCSADAEYIVLIGCHFRSNLSVDAIGTSQRQ